MSKCKWTKSLDIRTNSIHVANIIVDALNKLGFVNVEDGKCYKNYRISYKNVNEIKIMVSPMNWYRKMLLVFIMGFMYNWRYCNNSKVTIDEILDRIQLINCFSVNMEES